MFRKGENAGQTCISFQSYGVFAEISDLNFLPMLKNSCLLFLVITSLAAQAQPDRWQQRVRYFMDIDMNVTTNRFTGKQKLEYTNNSPDTLYKVFYHLYWNAFQPNSMMDTRSRELG